MPAYRKVFVTVFTTALVFAIFALGRIGNVNAEPAPQAGIPTAAYTEKWKTGITLEGSAVYEQIAGRLVSETAAFRSSSAADTYYVFPAPASPKLITNARFNLLTRSGVYTGKAVMTLEVHSLDGVLVRTAAAEVDLQTASPGAWANWTLDSDSANLVVQPGEYLCVHFYLDSSAGENLDARPIFEITLR
ncbi:MAG: hypothetical protein HY835_04265 [Anaerolineae bacterium]|nr:hypothetical protein [Anaerolineae bacterium]